MLISAGVPAKIDRGQHHGGDDGHRIGLEQIGRHAGAVADIVADVIGDRCRIARIVFRNAGFDLADQSPPTSAPLVKMPPPRRAKIEISDAPKPSADERVDDDAVIRRVMQRAGEEAEIAA